MRIFLKEQKKKKKKKTCGRNGNSGSTRELAGSWSKG